MSFDLINILGIILFIIFGVSGIMIIISGLINDLECRHFPSIMFFSGLFGTILICLSTYSNLGINWLSNISLILGVLSLICALIAHFLTKEVKISIFWSLTVLLLPLGLFCRWWVMTQENIMDVLPLFR